eukprot:13903171-Alexandrium_andersonii.AAC.1
MTSCSDPGAPTALVEVIDSAESPAGDGNEAGTASAKVGSSKFGSFRRSQTWQGPSSAISYLLSLHVDGPRMFGAPRY